MSRNLDPILQIMNYLYKNSYKISQIVLGIILGKINIFMQEDRDRNVTAASYPCLLGSVVRYFATFSPLLFVFHTDCSFTFPYD